MKIVISPLGKKKSFGTFDDFFDSKKHASIEAAWKADDFVQCNFTQDDDGVIYVTCFHSAKPEIKEDHRLQYPLVAGIDMMDDHLVCELAKTLTK